MKLSIAFLGNGIGEDAAKEIESLRQQLSESQAREKVLRDAMSLAIYQHSGKGDPHMNHWTAVFYNVLNANADSTALDSAIRQAKREALLEAADYADIIDGPLSPSSLRRMADKFK